MKTDNSLTRRSVLKRGAVAAGVGGVGTRTGTAQDDTSNTRTDLRLGFDARARSHRRGSPFDDLSNLDEAEGWYATNGDLSRDTDRHFHGSGPSSARLDGYSNNHHVGMAIDFPSGRAFSNRDLSLAVRLGEAAHHMFRVQLYAQTPSDQFVSTRYLSRADGWVRVDLGPTRVRGSPDLSDVRRLGIRTYTGGKRVRLNIDAVRTTPRRDSGAVVLTFDDNLTSHYDTAFPEMRERGMPGTVGVIPDLLGDDLTLDQLREMQDAGWTMASHPQGEDSSEGLGRVSRDRAERMIRDTKGWLIDHGFERGARCLIWPFGDHDRDALELAGEYHELSFGGGSSPSPGTVTEAAWVPRVNADDVDEALDAIDTADRFDQVLVLMFHSIGEDRISTADFNALLDRIETRNLEVLTASDFADEQRPPVGNPKVPPVGDAEIHPTDPNGDGHYEDVNGDGEVTYADVVGLFENFESSSVQDNSEVFDFNGNGRLGFDDIIELFESI